MFVLLGGSGSGKTTLLRALGGFVQPAAGRIMLNGHDITRPAAASAAGEHDVPVLRAVSAHECRRQCRRSGCAGRGVARAEIARRVGELLDLVRLSEFAARKPDALSGGQRQRVALARSARAAAALLLLDEPLSALDRGLREQTRQSCCGCSGRPGRRSCW